MLKKLRAKELHDLKEDLLDKKAVVLDRMKRFANDTEVLHEYHEQNDISSKADEHAEEMVEMLTTTAVIESLEKSLKDITQALKLIDQGGYGVCKYCSKDISIDRLRVRPVSTSCVECKSQFTD